jgi:3-hydroxyacyl-[acyl-carrier-protein] dehydratase
MRFNLVDRILAREAGKSLRAVKYLTLGEEYLADHFPTFPVMPGVLMLQALVESASWLWRLDGDFRHSVIALREVRNVKYDNFMQPGRRLELAVEWVKQDGGLATFKGRGETDVGERTVAAQFTLAGYNLGDADPGRRALDQRLIEHWRERAALLTRAG